MSPKSLSAKLGVVLLAAVMLSAGYLLGHVDRSMDREFGLVNEAEAAGGPVAGPNSVAPDRYAYYPGTEVLAEDEDRLVVGLRYAYRDYNRDRDDCDDEFRPLRCTIAPECRGFAERTFVIAKGEAGLEVVDMTGEQRRTQ